MFKKIKTLSLLFFSVIFVFNAKIVFANTEIPAQYLKKIVLKDNYYQQTLYTKNHPEFFDLYTKYYYLGEELKFASGSTMIDFLTFNFDVEKKDYWGVSKGGIQDFIRKELIPRYNQEPQKSRIFRNPKTKQIEFEGFARNGRRLDIPKMEKLLFKAIKTEQEYDSLILPFNYEKAKIQIDDLELKQAGVTELIATGESDFSHSSWKRIHNIQTGLSKFQGLVIPPGGIFSAVKQLLPITFRNGYVEELVIKEGKTIPELGGGLCQVSTTAYRGALLGGFEIIERSPHAYAVAYYSPYGTDATIYPYVKDFRFKNNTDAPLVIQTYLDIPNRKAYFNYFGQKTNRNIKLYGPYEVRKDLSLIRKGIKSPYRSFKAYWERHLDSSTGARIIEKIVSNYQSPALFH